jgi:hypothetical protein
MGPLSFWGSGKKILAAASLVLMDSMTRLLPLLFAFVSITALAGPKFDDFPSKTYSGPQAKVRLVEKKSLQYASVLRAAARKHPDFAGHYVLATWGCGASCVMGAAIDAKTGSVTWLPFTICCWDLTITEPVSFREDSRLLIVRGNRNEAGAGNDVNFYVFDGREFTLLAIGR